MLPGILQFKRGRGPLASGFIGAALTKLAGVALALAVVVVLARWLGPARYGVYAYVMALMSVLVIPVQFGLPKLVIRETARGREAGEWPAIRGLWRWSMGVATVFAVLIGLMVLAGSSLLSGHNLDVWAWGVALLPLLAWANLRAAALTGLQRVVLGRIPENVLRPGILLLLLLVGLFLVPTFRPDAASAMVLTVSAAFVSFAVAAGMLHYVRPAEPGNVRPAYRHRPWLVAAWPLAATAALQLINRHADILLLGLFVPAEQVGIYRVATQGANTVIFPSQVVVMVAAPYFARLHEAGRTERLQRVATLSARLTLAGALPVALALILFGKMILAFVVGEAYAAGSTALAILAAGGLVSAATGCVVMLLNMTGHTWQTVWGLAIAGGVNIALNFVLIPPLGMIGAALATSISILAWNLLLWIAVKRHLGLNSSVFILLRKREIT